MFKLMLDPGHGASDPGAVGNGLKEKDLVLEISLRIREILMNEYTDVDVRMTRETDEFVELPDRANMANAWGADYFMSIHVNAGGGSGFETYSHTSQSSASIAAQNVIHSEILSAMGQGITNRGKKNANFAVLRETKMPAILAEILFIDNANDVAKLKDVTFLEFAARGHINGLEKAFELQKKTVEVEQKDELSAVVNILMKAGIINSPDYWLANAKEGKTVHGEYAEELIRKVVIKLK